MLHYLVDRLLGMIARATRFDLDGRAPAPATPRAPGEGLAGERAEIKLVTRGRAPANGIELRQAGSLPPASTARPKLRVIDGGLCCAGVERPRRHATLHLLDPTEPDRRAG